MRIAFFLSAVSLGYCLAARAADSSLLYSFEQEQELQTIRVSHARASQKIRIFLLKPARPRTFVIDNVRLTPR